jgi:DNA invertase Pin-like site-specific DNA recombinase
VESGKNDSNRPQLHAAIAGCKKHKATLLIAKLDHFSRSVAFTAALLESPVKFVACETPNADRTSSRWWLCLRSMSTQISTRTKAVLAQATARGTKLANPRLSEVWNARNIAEADSYAQKIGPVLKTMRGWP